MPKSYLEEIFGGIQVGKIVKGSKREDNFKKRNLEKSINSELREQKFKGKVEVHRIYDRPVGSSLVTLMYLHETGKYLIDCLWDKSSDHLDSNVSRLIKTIEETRKKVTGSRYIC